MNQDILNAANKRKSALSLRAKIAFIPSLIFTVPFLSILIVFGLLVWTVAKILNLSGILEAINFQLKYVREKGSIQKMKKL